MKVKTAEQYEDRRYRQMSRDTITTKPKAKGSKKLRRDLRATTAEYRKASFLRVLQDANHKPMCRGPWAWRDITHYAYEGDMYYGSRKPQHELRYTNIIDVFGPESPLMKAKYNPDTQTIEE